MSKFVTYPAVTVLDNDHSLLIDDPNAGTNSITAENAGNTLLSKWAGFETFDEAVQNTIEHNQEFIDRDTAIRSETAELKKKIVTTFPAKEASGAVATFESEFEDAPLKSCIVQVNPVQDLHGYDHPWPAGGGKNKLQVTATSGVVSGVTITVNDDGSIKLVGTATAYLIFLLNENLSLESASWIFSGEGFGSLTGNNGGVFASSGTGATTDAINNKRDGDYAFSGTVGRIWLYFNSGTVFNNTLKLMIRPSSISDNTWQPYSNICPITGWTGCEVYDTGINVWDEEWGQGNINGTTGENNSDNNKIRSKNYIPVKPNTEYYINVAGGTKGNFVYFEYDRNNSYLGTQRVVNNGLGTLTTTANACYIRFRLTDTYGATYNNDISINYPSTDTTYHPYTGTTIPITWQSEAGTVYGGTLDVTGGELVVDRAMVDLGTLDWEYYQSSGKTKYYFRTLQEITNAKLSDGNIPNCVSDRYKVSKWSMTADNAAIDKCITFGWSGMSYIAVSDSTYSDVVTFKTAMSGAQLVYELATPITYQLTPTEIRSLLGTNNIWSNTGDTTVEHLMSDVSWYVEKKLRAFQSILAGVEDSETSSKNYSANTYLIFNNDIYRVTKAITTGETIEEGVNVTKTTVAEQLMALAQA